MKNSATLFLVFTTLAACGTPEKGAAPEPAKAGTPQASIEAKQLAAENEASFVAEVGFRQGQATLSKDARQRLDKVIRDARVAGKRIDAVTVIAWADREYPSVNAKQLPEAQRKLAANRADSIAKHIKGAAGSDSVNVDTYNMAERPNALERLVTTTDARLKRSLESAGIPNTDTSVKTPSKASKAIVMVTLDQ